MNIHQETAPGRPAAPSVMAALRRETRAAHDRIEEARSLARIFTEDFSRDDYIHLIGRLYGFYRPLEDALFDGLPTALAPELAHRRKTPLLAADLAALGLDAAEIATLALCPRLPRLDSQARRLGCLYVQEGATLGGTLIYRRLNEHFNGEIAGATAFYGCYGPQSGAEWRAFKATMGRLLDGDGDGIAEAVVTATETFALLTGWVDEAM